MRTITLNTIKVTQPIGELFITKIDQATLWEMSKVDRRHITNDDEVIGVQRELKADKIRQIKKYLTTINATFPNSIILNVNRENLIKFTFDYKSFYYLVGYLISLKKNSIDYTVRFRKMDEQLAELFIEIINVFLENNYDDELLLEYEHRIVEMIEYKTKEMLV